MWTTLVISLSISTLLHAGSTSVSINATSSTKTSLDNITSTVYDTTSSSLLNEDEELARITTTCLSKQDIELLSGSIVKDFFAFIISKFLARQALQVIGLTELRSALGFAPLPKWTHYKEPSAAEIDAAQTVEAYYDLKEPKTEERSLDSRYFFEHNFPPAIAFLDKQFPVVRASYRRGFEEIRREEVIIDRKLIDKMIEEWITIYNRVNDAIEKMFNYSSDYECTVINRKRKDD